MPLYEWHCSGCEVTFEGLAEIGRRHQKRPCPRCGRPAARVISRVVIAAGGNRADAGEAAQSDMAAADYIVPPAERFCWMDDGAAARMAAYQAGRGAEFDDKQAMAAERRKQRGAPAPEPLARRHPHGSRRRAPRVLAKTDT